MTKNEFIKQYLLRHGSALGYTQDLADALERMGAFSNDQPELPIMLRDTQWFNTVRGMMKVTKCFWHADTNKRMWALTGNGYTFNVDDHGFTASGNLFVTGCLTKQPTFPKKGEPGFMTEGVYRDRLGREITVVNFHDSGYPWASLDKDGCVVQTFTGHGDVMQGESLAGDLVERIQ